MDCVGTVCFRLWVGVGCSSCVGFVAWVLNVVSWGGWFWLGYGGLWERCGLLCLCYGLVQYAFLVGWCLSGFHSKAFSGLLPLGWFSLVVAAGLDVWWLWGDLW